MSLFAVELGRFWCSILFSKTEKFLSISSVISLIKSFSSSTNDLNE